MPFTAPDINLVTSNFSAANEQTYNDVFSHNFVAGKLYAIIVTGEENAAVDPVNSIGVPTTPGLTWSPVGSRTKTFSAIALYSVKPTENLTALTTVSFPGLQNSLGWCLVEYDNASATIINFTSKSWQAQSGTLTLDNVIGTDGLAMLFVAPANATVRTFSEGAGQTELSVSNNVAVYGQYNLTGTEAMPVGTDQGGHYMVVGFEVVFATEDTVLAITSVNANNPIADGDTGAIVGTNFATSGNAVTISPDEDINNAAAVTSTVSGEGATTTFDITANLPVGSSSEDPVYLFVNNGSEVTDGYAVSVTPIPSYFHTLTFTDGTNPVVIESPTANYESGWSFQLRVGGLIANVEDAISFTALTSTPDSNLEMNISFPSGKPDNARGDVLVAIYDEALGDLRMQSTGITMKSEAFVSPLSSTCV